MNSKHSCLSVCLFRILIGFFVGITMSATVLLTGCPRATEPVSEVVTPTRPVKLKLLVVGYPELGEIVESLWTAEFDVELTVASWTYEQLVAADFRLPADVDVVIHPGAVQADLIVADQLLEIPAEIWNGPDISKNELLPYYRTNLTRLGSKYFSAPLGGHQLVLAYRRDVFEQLNLSPPKSWRDFDAMVTRLSEQSELSPLLLPLGDHWPTHVLLARAAANVRASGKLSTLFQVESMQPLVDSPPFVDSLEWLEAMAAHSPADSRQWTPHQVYQELAAGNGVMGFTWPTVHVSDTATEASKQLAFVRLPGSAAFYDFARAEWIARDEGPVPVDYLGIESVMASPAKNSLQARQALAFVSWLCSKRTSGQIGLQSSVVGPFRMTQIADPLRWTGEAISFQAAEQYVDSIRAAHDSKLVLIFPRVARQTELFSTLTESINAVLDQQQSARDALTQTAEQWDQTIKKVGQPRQRELLRRGEGL